MTTKISTDNIQASSLEELEGGGGTRVYNTFAQLPLSGVETGDQAFIVETNRLYMWTGVGWFNIGLLNTNPTITSGPNATYTLSIEGTPTVLTLAASDPEGLPIAWSYQVTGGSLGSTATITQSNNVFTITPSTNTAHVGTFSITFTASDGLNIATAASSFTLTFGALDGNHNRSVILATSSTDNANNNTFLDSSTSNVTITRNGNTTQGTFSPFGPAGWSAFFDGTGDYLTAAVGTTLNVPANTNFTIEGWCYLDALVATRPAIFSNYNSFTTGGLAFWAGHSSSTTTQFQVALNGTFPALNAGTIPYDSWFHWAIVRNGTGSNNINVYINGVSIGSITSNVAITSTGNTLWLGASGDAVANAGIDGYMSNFRWVTGTALYTANFTPPIEPLAAVPNTVLLTLQDNRFKDDSTNNSALTPFGNARVAPLSPFRAAYEYNPTVHGGSAYFDGTGDFLNATTASAPGTGNFTFEAWIYVTNLSAGRLIFTTRSGNTLDGLQVQIASTGQFRVGYQGVDFIQTDTGIGTANQWIHVAVTRSSGTVTLWVNGINRGSDSRGNDFTSTAVRLGLSAENLLPMFGYISNARYVIGTALYTANFTPPTQLLTNISGTALLVNSTNAGVYDETGKFVMETVGNVRASTSIVKYGNTSIFFDGTGDHLLIPNDQVFNFGSGNFTIEAWIYPTSVTGERGIACLYGYTSNRRTWDISISDGVLRCRLSNTGSATTNVNTGSGAVVINQWQHIAFVRNGTSVVGYVNGVSVVTGTFSGSAFNNTVDPVSIGAVGPSYTGFFVGHISDLRITKGAARYTSNFTPPTAKLGFNNAE